MGTLSLGGSTESLLERRRNISHLSITIQPESLEISRAEQRVRRGAGVQEVGAERTQAGVLQLWLDSGFATCWLCGSWSLELQVPPVQNGDKPAFSPESLRI